MSLKLKLILIGIMVAFILYMCLSIRKHQISVKHSFIWLMASFIAILCIIFINYLFKIANLIGIEKASNMLFFISIIFLVVICFNLSSQLSSQNNKIIKLTQELSLLKNEIEKGASSDNKK